MVRTGLTHKEMGPLSEVQVEHCHDFKTFFFKSSF